jgi:hypothetical protein
MKKTYCHYMLYISTKGRRREMDVRERERELTALAES